MRVQLAIRPHNSRLGRANLAADVNGVADAAQWPCLGVGSAHDVEIDLAGRVAHSSGQFGLHGTTEREIQ